jgi:hypothetical protein
MQYKSRINESKKNNDDFKLRGCASPINGRSVLINRPIKIRKNIPSPIKIIKYSQMLNFLILKHKRRINPGSKIKPKKIKTLAIISSWKKNTRILNTSRRTGIAIKTCFLLISIIFVFYT